MKTIITVLSLIFSMTSFAAPPKPKACPSVSDLKQVQFSKSINDGGDWIAYTTSNFNTDQAWTFMSFNEEGNDAEKSINIANLNVKATQFISGPELDRGPDGKEHWFCGYYANNSFEVAVTPLAPFPFKKFIR